MHYHRLSILTRHFAPHRYLIPAIVFILPLNSAWSGAGSNTLFLFLIAPIILFFGSQLLMGVCSAAFKVFLICDDLPKWEAMVYRLKFAVAVYVALAVPTFIVFWSISFTVIFPVPWAGKNKVLKGVLGRAAF